MRPYSSKSCTCIFCISTGPKYCLDVVTNNKLFCVSVVKTLPCNEMRANIFLFKIEDVKAP